MKPTNVFVLTAGRTGSMTFYKACSMLHNYSVGHESRCGLLGSERFAYPLNHIEIDCRLVWFLGKLHKYFPENVYYVHLKRKLEDTAKSWEKRWEREHNMLYGYVNRIMMVGETHIPLLHYAYDMIDTINTNIEDYLVDKSHITIEIDGSDIISKFYEFLQIIEARNFRMSEFNTVLTTKNNKSEG